VPVAVVVALAATIVWSIGRKLRDGDVSVQQAAGPAVAEPAADEGAVPRASVAVMPLANATGDPSLRYLGDGIAEELIYSLARVKGSKSPPARRRSPTGAGTSTSGRSRALSASRPCSKAVCDARATPCA
jgi:hypothetical protein